MTISSQSNYSEAILGGRNSGLDEALGEHHYLNNDNAAVDLSPAIENVRIDRGSVGGHLHISSPFTHLFYVCRRERRFIHE
jgi:hypothetical protein